MDIVLEKANYIKKKEWENRYPSGSGGYRVEGAIGKKLAKEKGKLIIGDQKEQIYYELPNGYIRYKVKGYIEIGQDQYLAVLKTRIWEWLLCVVLVPCIVAIVVVYQNSGPDIDPGSGKYKPDIEISEQIDPDKIVIPGFSDVKMKANTDIAYVALWNPDRNPCYFKYTIKLVESDEIIYESKLIPPGEAVTTVKLNQIIPGGITKATMQIEAFNLEDYKVRMNGGEVNIKLVGLDSQE